MRSASETRAGVYLGSTSIALLHAHERDALGLLRSRARVSTRTGRSNGIPIAARTGAAAVAMQRTGRLAPQARLALP
jgi:hypothetical protein